MNREIVTQLFEYFKSSCGLDIHNAEDLFETQRNLLEYLMNLGRELENQVFDELGARVQTLAMMDKLIENFDDNTVELFHLASDRGEQTNLSSQRPDKRRELLSQLINWRKSVGATKDAPKR